jgi:AcrR family transcriptional regulator/DNA-binding MarR family transcriptional regulator
MRDGQRAAGGKTAVRRPRGGLDAGPARSGVGRARVSEIQRARMLTAITEVARERGAGNVTVAHVVARSGVSRRTFYELFEDREDCFLAALDHAIARGAESVMPTYASAGPWRERIRSGLAALLEFLDEEPAMGALCIVDALSAGPTALARRAELLSRLTDVVHEGRTEARTARKPTRLVAEGVVGAVLSVIHLRLSGEDRGRLRGLLNPLMSMIVLPYLGQAAAEQELERPAPRRSRAPRAQSDPLRDLDMRLTYRTVRVLVAVAAAPGASNRQVADASGITDQGQISKLLHRLQTLGLVRNTGGDHAKGEPNAWSLTPKGREVDRTIRAQTGDVGP